jgi:serine phosphatase RsbU (regulator of sigma subunit)/PAS domain-containing protein/anti-sigma regulatory factor (Ser/Thr protein kinase)
VKQEKPSSFTGRLQPATEAGSSRYAARTHHASSEGRESRDWSALVSELRDKNRLMVMAEQMSHIGHWRLDLKSKKVFWSEEMYRTFDLPPTFQPTLENSMAAYHPEDREKARTSIGKAATEGVPYNRESRVVRPDGSLRYVITSGQPEYASDGTLIAIFGVFQDITESKLAESERAELLRTLTDGNRLMKMAEEMAHYGHWRIDLLSKEVYWSDEVCRIHGLPITYRPTLEAGIATYDSDGPDIGAIVRQASIDGKPFAYESRILRPDDSFRDVHCLGRGEFAANGSLIALVGIFQDVTNRKDAERLRDRLAERVTHATEIGNIGSWEWVMKTGAMTWLTHMHALYGLDPLGTTPSYELWKSVIDERDQERVVRTIEDAFSRCEAFDAQFRVVWPNGEIHNIRSQATVLLDDAGQPVRMVGIAWDKTDMHNLADEMHADQERLEALERERLYEHERRWSRTFQRAVLPLSLPQLNGCTFDAVYIPGSSNEQVGGDWYDAVQLADGRVLVSIGDVSGSGLHAAVVVGVARQIVRGISQLHADPVLILDAADRALSLEYPGVYVSVWIGVIDLVTGTVTYASAGHPPPLLVSNEGVVRELSDPTSLLIGLRKGHRGGEARTFTLAQGDAMVLYTDGLTESTHDVVAGTLSLRDAASAFATSPDAHPAQSIKLQVIPNGSADDVAILVVRTDALEAGRHIDRWKLDVGNGDAASIVRGKFVAFLARLGFTPEACANAELVFGELVGNVLRHTNHTGDVEIAVNNLGSDAVLHVIDNGGGFNHISRLPHDPYAEDGRGLFLIAALTEDFTVSQRPSGGSHARAVLPRYAA